mmetsp:Transcript_3567/g.10246  ORF Transcript_3567/g.10246 Transcript_3567/m.10246 type:complete len:542 (-) Transcript_3567:482-2107(-)
MASPAVLRSMGSPVASCSSRMPATARGSASQAGRQAAAAAAACSSALLRPSRSLRRSQLSSRGACQRFAPFRRPVRCDASGKDELSLAPGEPKTPFGEMLKYYLQMEPQLFQAAVDEKFAALQEAKQEEEEQSTTSSPTAALDLVLYRRMNEVKAREMQDTVEDLMYLSILEKFVLLQVSMLPRMEGEVDIPHSNLKALTEGIHSKEALAMVKDHLMSMMGPTGNAFSNSIVKMSKLQMTQVYAASVMFGYFLRRYARACPNWGLCPPFSFAPSWFASPPPTASQPLRAPTWNHLFTGGSGRGGRTVHTPHHTTPHHTSKPHLTAVHCTAWAHLPWQRAESAGHCRVDKRFKLEQAFGTLEDSISPASSVDEDAVARLNRLFNAASAMEPGEEEEMPSTPQGDEPRLKSVKRQASLKEYVESFDQAMLMETAQVLTIEAAALVERQTTALFGDIKALQQQMSEAVGEDVASMEDLMQRVSDAVRNDKVDTLKMTVNTQRHAVLEAVAYGTFLRDVESHVDSEYQLLLTAAPKATPPGMLDA